MDAGVLAILATFALPILILVLVYRSPECNGLEELRVNLFQKAQMQLNLTPEERALLKLLQGFLLAGVESALLAVPTVISMKADQPIISAVGLGAMAGAFVHGFVAAWQKYVSAKGDAPLSGALGAVDKAIGQRLGSGGSSSSA